MLQPNPCCHYCFVNTFHQIGDLTAARLMVTLAGLTDNANCRWSQANGTHPVRFNSFIPNGVCQCMEWNWTQDNGAPVETQDGFGNWVALPLRFIVTFEGNDTDTPNATSVSMQAFTGVGVDVTKQWTWKMLDCSLVTNGGGTEPTFVLLPNG